MAERPRVSIQSPERVRSPELERVREEDEIIPMHHMVLYDLLGEDKAESILNPKIEEPARRQSIHPAAGSKLSRLPSIDTGMGAEAIWKMLKDKSDRKINRLERKIPAEWKQAYGAFLRDRLNQNKTLLFRSFTGKADVPNLDILKKQDYIYKVRKMRNHTNVMYRSSEHNLNHTMLLLNNNPAPECAKREESVSLSRYFSESDLQANDGKRLPSIEYPKEMHELPRQNNLHFLTNEGAKCKGTFYAKYAGDETVKMVTDVPGYKVKLPPSMTARYSVSAPVGKASFAKEWRKEERLINDVKPTPWEPLTCGALMEYAPVRPLLGSGDFKHGRLSQWRNTASAGS